MLNRLERGLMHRCAAMPVDPADHAELEAQGLVDADGRLSPLGAKIDYHLAEFRRQAGDDFITPELLQRARLGVDARVLDVGCGAGQSLRQLAAWRPAERVGVDTDPVALALGRRLASRSGDDLHFVRAASDALPFGEGRFTNVLCRVALNYMHQRIALAEMARVLAPGGFIYCRIEGPGHDLALLTRAVRSLRARVVARRLRDLVLGLVLEATGRQPALRGRLAGDRVFASARRVGQFLSDAGCEVRSAGVQRRHGGLPSTVEILAVKCNQVAW